MADSCRPVSRHGRYHAPGRNVNTSSRYTDDIPSYSTIDYVDQEDVYQLKQQAVTMDIDSMERPKTSTGRRNRPKSRMGRTPVQPRFEAEDENQGRPASRRGYTPETYKRHDYDEYSRQTLTLDSQISSDDSSGLSPPTSPAGRQGSPVQMRPSPAPQSRPRQSPFGERMQMSPSNRQQRLSGFQSPALTPSPQQRPMSANRFRTSPSENFTRNSPADRINQSAGDTAYSQLRRKSSGSMRSSFSRDSSRRDQPHYGNENYIEDTSSYYHERPPSPSTNHPTSNQDYDGYYINQDTGYDRNQESYQGYERTDQENIYHQENKKQRSSARAKSGKKRRPPGSARKKQNMLDTEPESVIENLPTPATMRPTSSLTRYKLLPAIGTPQAPRRDEMSLDSLSLKTKRMDLSHEEQYSSTKEPLSAGHTTDQPYSRSLYRSESDFSEEQRSKGHSVSSEDPDNRLLPDYQGAEEMSSNQGNSVSQESSIFIPHKLPVEPSDGETRILLAVRLLDGSRKQRYFRVTDKLEVVLQFAENCVNCALSLYDLVRNMPRVVYTDLNVLVGEADLEDRTVLYLEEKDS
ncbi:uncharacterized protein [Argopecten irradians]|uniref:uncharacterized protein n=1 Tax=Argopecten irradians TaxID=31199 RepID=UPI00371A3A53